MLKRAIAYGIVLSAAAAVIWKKFSPRSKPPESITFGDRDLDFTFQQQAMLAAIRQQVDEIRTAGFQPVT
jgi:hypothetical protein